MFSLDKIHCIPWWEQTILWTAYLWIRFIKEWTRWTV